MKKKSISKVSLRSLEKQHKMHVIALFKNKRNKDALLFSLLYFPTVIEHTFLCGAQTTLCRKMHFYLLVLQMK